MASPLPLNIKSEIRDELFKFIFKPSIERFQLALDKLIEKNDQLHGDSRLSMVHRQQQYLHSSLPATHLPQLPMLRVHLGIRDEFEKYLAERTEYKAEEHRGMSAIISILNATDSLEDYFELFPDSLQVALRQLQREGKFDLPEGMAPPKRLSQEQLDALQVRVSESVNVIRQRLLLNLLD